MLISTVLNIVFAAGVLVGIVGLLTWAILTQTRDASWILNRRARRARLTQVPAYAERRQMNRRRGAVTA